MKQTLLRSMILCCIALPWSLVAGCAAPDPDWDGIVQVDYRQRFLEKRIKRRINLINGGVALNRELAADSVWRAANGYTLIAHRPQRLESITRLQVRRLGVVLDEKPVGIGRDMLGRYSLEEGFWLVDVFSTMDVYMGSAAVSRRLPVRRLLLHLGLAHKLVEDADRMHLEPKEQLFWRQQLPEVIRNRGYGQLYLPRETVQALAEGTLDLDTLEVKADRYILEEMENYILVGRQLENGGFLHVFSAGHQYRTTLLFYGTRPPDGAEALKWLGWNQDPEQR
jgi:hypothetical protein